MFLKGFEGWHLVIIAGLLVVLFGARKLPDSARSIGQSLRIFKSEMKAAGQDGDGGSDAHTKDALAHGGLSESESESVDGFAHARSHPVGEPFEPAA